MSDNALLRLAKIVAHLTWNTYADGDARTAEAEQLVRDLEAAPPPETERPPSPVETALREFAGFISGDIPELHSVEVPRIAESVSRYLNAAGPHVPPAPARRTITREERDAGAQKIANILGWPNDDRFAVMMADKCAAAWRLTVEDA